MEGKKEEAIQDVTNNLKKILDSIKRLGNVLEMHTHHMGALEESIVLLAKKFNELDQCVGYLLEHHMKAHGQNIDGGGYKN